MGHVWKASRRYRRPLVGATVFSIIEAALQLLRPWPLRLAIDNGLGKRAAHGPFGVFSGLSPRALVITAAALSVGLTILLGLCNYGGRVLAEGSAERLGSDLRQQTFDRAMALNMRFHQTTRSGEIVYRLTNDLGRVLDLVVVAFAGLVPDLLLVVGTVVLLLVIDPILAAIALAVVPLLAFLASRQRRRVKAAQYAARAASGQVSSTATDLVRNARAVQAFGRERFAGELFKAKNDSALRNSIKAMRVDARWSPRADIVLAAGSGLVLAIGSLQVLDGRLTIGTLLVVVSYVGGLYSPVRSLARLSSTFAKGTTSAARLAEILDSTESVQEAPGAPDSPGVHQGICVQNVHFGYREGAEVLQGMNFYMPSGSSVCLVGRSGAGKTTVLNLLLRLYDPDAGSILIDGVDIRTVSVASLRKQIALVLQDPWLIDGTIADNIAFGCEGASLEQVLEAGRLSLVDEFALALPLGYDSPVGEGGSQLSGGQRQRIAIARAVLSHAPLILLDEPTSSLDTDSKSVVIDAIRNATAGRTVVMVTHDLDLADSADRIVVLSGGRVAEEGSPFVLSNAGGLYASSRTGPAISCPTQVFPISAKREEVTSHA